MAIRQPISTAVRKQVIARDGNLCRKCGRDNKLELHHILPVANDGPNETDNLAVLCTSCHREWEHLIYPHVKNITFEKWLEVPPCLSLFVMFMQEELWRNDLTAKEVRAGIIQSYDMFRSLEQ